MLQIMILISVIGRTCLPLAGICAPARRARLVGIRGTGITLERRVNVSTLVLPPLYPPVLGVGVGTIPNRLLLMMRANTSTKAFLGAGGKAKFLGALHPARDITHAVLHAQLRMNRLLDLEVVPRVRN